MYYFLHNKRNTKTYLKTTQNKYKLLKYSHFLILKFIHLFPGILVNKTLS